MTIFSSFLITPLSRSFSRAENEKADVFSQKIPSSFAKILCHFNASSSVDDKAVPLLSFITSTISCNLGGLDTEMPDATVVLVLSKVQSELLNLATIGSIALD